MVSNLLALNFGAYAANRQAQNVAMQLLAMQQAGGAPAADSAATGKTQDTAPPAEDSEAEDPEIPSAGGSVAPPATPDGNDKTPPHKNDNDTALPAGFQVPSQSKQARDSATDEENPKMASKSESNEAWCNCGCRGKC